MLFSARLGRFMYIPPVRSAALFECRDSALQRFRVKPLSGVPTGERRGVTCLVRKAL
jgi:hypothetical protein